MNKQAYNYLNSLRWIDLKLLRLNARKKELESCLLPAAIRYDKDKVQTSPEDPMSKICAEISEIDNEIYCISVCKADKIRELSNTIHNLERPEERTVLTLYFIEHIKIKEIAKRMNYTENGIYGIRRKACNNIVKYLPKVK